MGNFRTVLAWQKAMDLVDSVYAVVRLFPQSEQYELSAQMRSSAVSIPSLIAEGKGRYTVAAQQHFYREARGSNYELQTQIEIAKRQQFTQPETAEKLTNDAEEVGRLINGLLNSLRPKA